MNRLVRRLLRGGLGEVDARVLTSEMDELYRRKIETDGQAAADAWRRRQTRGAAIRAVAARVRGPRRPAAREGDHARAGAGGVPDAILQDLRSGVRALVATPVVTLVATVSLALGTGACTALFSICNSLLLRPLPVREPSGLAALGDSVGNSYWSNPQWEQVRARASLFDGAAASSAPTRLNASASGQADPVDGLYVSGRFFETLGVPAHLGRVFTGRDDERGGGPDGPVAVLNYTFWQRRYSAAADVIGRTITLDRVAFTIVGVAPPGFFGVTVGSTFDVAVPLGTEALVRGAGTFLDQPDSSWLNVLVRLKPGQSVAQATAAIRAVQPQIREATLRNMSASRAKRYLARPLEFQPATNGLTGYLGFRARYARPILLLLAAAGLLLLVACANIANVGLARATARSHEAAVRAALGASKARLARPLFAESLLLSGVGALAGLVVARVGAEVLVSGLSTSMNRAALDLALDWRVLAFTIAMTTVATTLFGVGPALRAAGARPQEALAYGGRGPKAGGRAGVSGALVIVQVALSLVLVVSAGLFGRTLGSLSRLDPGFDRSPVLIAEFEPSRSASDAGLSDVVLQQVLIAARGVPGVSRASASFVTPVSGQSSKRTVEVLGEPQPENAVAYQNIVTPGWFGTYGTNLVAGRDFDDRDARGSTETAVVNRAFTRRFLPGKDPLGHVIVSARDSHGDATRTLTIVGVVEDAAYITLRERPRPTYYTAYAQRGPNPFWRTSLGVRSAGPPVAALMRPLAAAFGAVQPNLSFTLRPLADQVDATLDQERLLAKLSGFFGGLALLLSALGLYGVTTYSVTRRRGEIGIRLAMGGTPANVVRLVVRRVVWLVGVGLVAGCVSAYWAARFVTALLYGVESRDPVTFVAAAAVLAFTALLAGAVPAWRASRVDPTTVLRAL